MKFTNSNDFNGYLFGALKAETKDGWTRFTRFTDRQLELNAKRNCAAKNYSCVSMSIEFMTDAKRISFKWKRIPQSDTRHFSFDILADGVIVGGFCKDNYTEPYGECDFEIPGNGKRHVSLRLPNYAGIEISDFETDGEAEKIVKEKRILVLGDSITQGAGSGHTSLSYANVIADKLNMSILNQAIGGDVFFADNLGEDIGFDPDVITVSYGTNGWAGGRDAASERKRYFEKLKRLYPGATVFAVLPIWRDDGFKEDAGAVNRLGFTLDEVRNQIAANASLFGFNVLNGKNYVPHLKECFIDGLHPNATGYSWYAEGMLKDMLPLIR